MFHPNELLIIVMLSVVGHEMCPCLCKILVAGVTVATFISFYEAQKPPFTVYLSLSVCCIVSKLGLNFCQIKKSFHFFVDALLVTWSGWTELKSPVFTPCAQHVRVTEEHAWPSRHRSSPATAPKVTEVVTAKQRWPSTGRTWAWASALFLPSASASWLY